VDLHRLHHLLVSPSALGGTQISGHHQVARHQLCLHQRDVAKLVCAEKLRPLLLLLSDRQLEEEEGRVCFLHLLHLQRRVGFAPIDARGLTSRLGFAGWKRLLLADAPRQVVNAITLYSFGKSENWTTDFSVYFGGSILKAGVIITMLFTLVIWVGSAILLIIAAAMYIPLLCYIQGNLKEYCCHKVDKRCVDSVVG
jgi:hypothetical protein